MLLSHNNVTNLLHSVILCSGPTYRFLTDGTAVQHHPTNCRSRNSMRLHSGWMSGLTEWSISAVYPRMTSRENSDSLPWSFLKPPVYLST